MAYTARHTRYKIRLTEHVHAEQTNTGTLKHKKNRIQL